MNPIPSQLDNFIGGEFIPPDASRSEFVDKLSPVDGRVLCRQPNSTAETVSQAVEAASDAFAGWSAIPPVARGVILRKLATCMERDVEILGQIVAEETGKSPAEAGGEVGGAAALGHYYAGEGQRLYGRSTTSGVAGRMIMNVRRPKGVAGLIVAANTPIANVAWKLFPALICGNTVVLKTAEDTPATGWYVAKLAVEAGVPAGVLNVVHGLGRQTGGALVAHSGVDVVSFTGSAAVGREIHRVVSDRLARVSLELGGKNPLVVCDDADLDLAVNWSVLSAFSNAGQRCAAAGRILVFDSVYDEFRKRFHAATEKLKVGYGDEFDLGPVINRRQLDRMAAAVQEAIGRGATVLAGGAPLEGEAYDRGCFMAPTILEDVDPQDPLSCTELFGPIVGMYRIGNFDEAVALANDSPYGLTAAIHTGSVNRAMRFAEAMRSGLVSINGGTFGSEPHLSFGGFKQSGNGTREPGVEGIDVYTELQHILINMGSAQ